MPASMVFVCVHVRGVWLHTDINRHAWHAAKRDSYLHQNPQAVSCILMLYPASACKHLAGYTLHPCKPAHSHLFALRAAARECKALCSAGTTPCPLI